MGSALRRRLGHDLAAEVRDDAHTLGLGPGGGDPGPVTEHDLASLPEPAARYLRFMGVVGRPRDRSFEAAFRGRFRLRPAWRFLPCEAWQYNTRFPVARLFHLRIDGPGRVPMVGRDSYVDGHGRMRGRLLGSVPLVDGRGPEFDVSELVTWLNDAVLLAPSMLLDPATVWRATGDDDTFEVSFTDWPLTVSARVQIDADGAVVDFSTTDRFAALPEGLVRAEWSTPVSAWSTDRSRPIPGSAAATWHLPDGPFTYAEGLFLPGTVTYNAAPGGPEHGAVATIPGTRADR